MTSYRRFGHTIKEHHLEVPWDYSNPHGTFGLYAREIIPPGGEDLPALLYLQGGPGFPAPRPLAPTGLIGKALERYRVILMDQRGTGRSHRIDALSPAAERTAKHLALLRQDNIVRDAERLREHLGLEKWSLFGQSFGGFCITAYLSQAPERVEHAFFTGGIPTLKGADDLYRATFSKLKARQQRFYREFPWAQGRIEEIISHLDNSDERLPTGERLSALRFRTIGIELGRGTGFDSLAYLLEEPFRTVAGEKRLRGDFLADVGQRVSFADGPLYAAIHESIYGGAGGQATTNWAAHRVREEFPEFAESGTWLTGEHIFPWQFDEDPALHAFADAAHGLARHEFSPPYALDEVPTTAAAIYVDDIFVPLEESLATAAHLGDLRPWINNEFQHNGIREDGATVLGKLFSLIDDH